MNRKKTKRRIFSFMWDGLIHLEDGSQWHLADPERIHDVTWWQPGETVAMDQNDDELILCNVSRREAVTIVAVEELTLKLAA
jgi:hypothetical protein